MWALACHRRADGIKLSASRHRAIFWNPSTQKKKMNASAAAPARDAQGAQSRMRRGQMRRDATHPQTLPACLSPCRLSRRDSPADPATLCLRHSTIASPAPGCITASLCVRARRRAACTQHLAVTPVRAASQRQQIWRALHRHAWSRCKGPSPALHTPVSAVPPCEAAEEWCALPIGRATSNGAVQALSHASTHRRLPQPIMGRRRGPAQWAGR